MTGTRLDVHGSKVDLTLKSIHGIVGNRANPFDVTAAVSFTGSAQNMQVSSFTMCGRTGNLVVESNSLEVEPSPTVSQEEEMENQTQRPLVATFNDPMESRRSLPSCGMSTSSSSSSQRPHLKLKLSGTHPNVPKRSLTTVNRTHVIQQSVSQDGESITDASRGASVYWEAENDIMPEIIELHIVLHNADHAVSHEGIAHLLFYGSPRELGMTTMDLRIKKKASAQTPNSTTSECLGNPSCYFTEDAFIRVQVEVTSSDHPVPSPEEMILSEDYDERKIGNIMSQLKEHEEMAAARAKANKMVLEEDVKQPRRIFCNGGMDFGDTVRALMDAFTKCEGKRRKCGAKRFIPIIRTSSTMESTIETRESLLI